jgi:hypothetical protein
LDVQGVGHHHQAGLPAQLGHHRRRGAAAVDDDPRMLLDTRHAGAGDGGLVGRHGLRSIHQQFLRHWHRPSITAQQQASAFEGGEVFADGDFGGSETLGQLVDADLALLGEQREDIMAALGCITFRHGCLSFDSKEYIRNQNLNEG